MSFVLCIFFFYKQSKKPPEAPRNQWDYDISGKSQSVSFRCDGLIPYTFSSRHGFGILKIGTDDPITNIDNILERKTMFNVMFKNDTNLVITPYVDGVYFKRGAMRITKGAEGGLKLNYLTPGVYNTNYIKAEKGERLDIKGQSEHIYMGCFSNGKLLWESLIKANTKSIFSFFENCQIAFKSAEVPYLMAYDFQPSYESYTVVTKVKASPFFNIKEESSRAVFIDKGETFNTGVWIDKDDEIRISSRESFPDEEDVKIYIGDKPVKFSQGPVTDFWVDRSGILAIKAKKRVVITGLSIKRNNFTDYKLNADQSKRIKCDEYDSFLVTSKNNFYINNEFFKAGSYHHKVSGNKSFEIKASVIPSIITVQSVMRKGH